MEALGEEQLSVKAMMERIGLKDRENFLYYSLNPSMNEGYVRMLYPESPRHPRQKYLLTVKGLALYNDNGCCLEKRSFLSLISLEKRAFCV